METSATGADSLSPLKQAILELRHLRARLDDAERAKSEPIAIVGMGLRLPGGATNPDAFWRLLHEGVDAVTEVPPSRWDVDAYYDPDPNAPGKVYTRYGAFLEGVDLFEPQFFGISPREAVALDPQQRLLLEVGWEALENAGQAPSRLQGTQTGVYIGMANSDYFRLVFADTARLDAYCGTGSILSVAAGRLSYLLGLHGPSLIVDTACSSSLVAVHLACQSLRSGECRQALAGGVNLILTPEITINHCRAQMMAPDGRCKAFDARADGYVRGEGCAVVVLKRLSDAVAEGDRVLALIRGSAVNHDGRSGGLTAPNGPAQEAVIRAALAGAGVSPLQVSYVEAHGTGTSLGDPIEVQALASVLGQDRDRERPLLVGTVKTNIGHLETAAGIAGLLKVVLALQHDEIPPNLHLQQPNPYIPWAQLPVAVPVVPTPWPAGQGPRLAGLSSFGLSGTNAHLVIEEAPAESRPPSGVERPLHLLVLSARSEESLRAVAAGYDRHLSEHGEQSLADVCYTAAAGRSHFEHRLVVPAASVSEARERLQHVLSGQSPVEGATGRVTPSGPLEVAFLFTGQGAIRPDMGRQLYETQPTFRAVVERCDRLLRPWLAQPLLSALYPQTAAPSLLSDTEYAQPALFVLEYALAVLWRSWGIEPTVLMGHSLGEYVAACVAEVFSLEDALRLVAARGRLIGKLASEDAEMVAVYAGEAQVAAALAPYAAEVGIAAINGPDAVVISGRRQAVRRVLEDLQAEHVESKVLAMQHGFHSPLTEPLLDAFESEAARVSYSSPRLALVSGLTGQLVQGVEVAAPSYWRRHLRQPVQFARAVGTLWQEGYRNFLEVGPHPTLIGMARRYLTDDAACWLPSLRQGREDWAQLLESLGALYLHGASVDWQGFDRDYKRCRLPLPTYPWQRQSYWWTQTGDRQESKDAEPSRWQSILAVAGRQSRQAPLDLALPDFPAKWQCLDHLATAIETRTLRQLGAFREPEERQSADSLLARFGIQPTYRHLMSRWLNGMAKEGWLRQEADGSFASVQPLPEPAVEPLLDAASEHLGDAPDLLAYVRDCAASMASILAGKASPLDTLFPGGSFARAEGLYERWALARYFGGIAGAAAQQLVGAVVAERPARVLEVGAGVGAMTASILPVLPADGVIYHYTDVSDLFLTRARQKFNAYSGVRYGLLDVERDPEAQGYPSQVFDLVVASNVLHATSDLRATLRHVLSLLAPGGVLLLHETTDHPAWFDVTVGLVEGWQRFDDGLRGDSPLLAAAQWERALLDAGFAAVAAFPQAGSLATVLGQHVLLAQAVPSGGPRHSGAACTELERLEASGQPATELAQPADADPIVSLLRDALPGERLELLTAFVRQQLARVLRLAGPDSIDRRHRLMDLGVDSLMAVELRSLLSKGLGLQRELPATLVFNYPTAAAIAEYLATEILASATATAPVSPVGGPQPGQAEGEGDLGEAARRIEQLSDEEATALLMRKLGPITG
ncbi:MAG: type I polyketide synthase [Chloroflexota bacterium]